MIEFLVSGLPVPKGSMWAITSHSTGRPIVIPSNAKGLAEWAHKIEFAASEAMKGHPALQGPVRVTLAFALPMPKSRPRKKRTWPDKRPDLDKLLRAVLDALTHIVLEDDGQVVRVYASKAWAWDYIEVRPTQPGVRVCVELEG